MRYERWQPIYQYVLLIDGYKPEYADVVSRALESLPADFPAALYAAAARRFIERDQPVEQTGIVGYMVEHHRAELYPAAGTDRRQDAATGDLHRYAVIQMAAARDPALNELLFALAKRCPLERDRQFHRGAGTRAGQRRDRQAVADAPALSFETKKPRE